MERIGGVTQTEYLQQANDSLLKIVQIETKDALHYVSAIHNLKGLEEKTKVRGVDVRFCRPFDLGNNIGCPILNGSMDNELKEAIARIQRIAKKNDKACGFYATCGDQAREYANQGSQMVSVATDAASLPAHLHSALTAARGSHVHSVLNIAKGAFQSQ
ncbi:MAG: hypothetical protein Q9177_006583 [Variospora cf. flavescens]